MALLLLFGKYKAITTLCLCFYVVVEWDDARFGKVCQIDL